MTEAFNLILKNYPEKVTLSEKRNTKYILKGTKLNKYQQARLDNGIYTWQQRGTGSAKGEYLFDATSSVLDFVPKNPKAAGTPNIKTINGQIFWEGGSGNEWLRKAIKDFLRAYFVPSITRQLPDKIFAPKGKFIQFEYVFFYPLASTTIKNYQDYINHAYVRSKVFEDVLQEMEYIVSDGPTHVRGGYARYVNIDEGDERRLEIKIHFCDNNQRIS